MARDGYIDTAYGEVPGCSKCDAIPLTGPHICEHGVTPAPNLDVSMEFEVDWSTYERLLDRLEQQPLD